MLSKLWRGNTYVLKVRDDRNVVTALHVLDPTRVQPLVSDDGSVFYRLSSDNLVRAVRHHRARARDHPRPHELLFHPLVGAAGVCLRPRLDARPQRAEGIRAAVRE